MSMFEPMFRSKWQENRKKKKINNGSRELSWGSQLLYPEIKIPSSESGSCQSHYVCHHCSHGLAMREQRKRRKEKLGDVHSLQPLGVFFLTSQARSEGLLMEQPVFQIPFPVSSCVQFTGGYHPQPSGPALPSLSLPGLAVSAGTLGS